MSTCNYCNDIFTSVNTELSGHLTCKLCCNISYHIGCLSKANIRTNPFTKNTTPSYITQIFKSTNFPFLCNNCIYDKQIDHLKIPVDLDSKLTNIQSELTKLNDYVTTKGPKLAISTNNEVISDAISSSIPLIVKSITTEIKTTTNMNNNIIIYNAKSDDLLHKLLDEFNILM